MIQAVSIVGALAILVAYAANQFRWLGPNNVSYTLLNVVGASALTRFTVPARQRSSRGMRKRGQKVPARRGHFVDVCTLARAMLGGSWSLGRLSEHLEVEHGKLETDEHGSSLTREYLEYAVQDVQATWECFEQLQRQYKSYGLTETPIDKIYSQASLGKAYLKQMKVKPWRELQPDFPQELLGTIMDTYYGGRSEVHVRREVTQVLYCDFLSMYPGGHFGERQKVYNDSTIGAYRWKGSLANHRDIQAYRPPPASKIVDTPD